MAASDAIIETILRIQAKIKTSKKTKGFLLLSFDLFTFICSEIITSSPVHFLAIRGDPKRGSIFLKLLWGGG